MGKTIHPKGAKLVQGMVAEGPAPELNGVQRGVVAQLELRELVHHWNGPQKALKNLITR